MYKAKYLDVVLTDVKQAKTWYKQQQEGLEERFASSIEKTINKILKMPTGYAVRYKNVRIAHTDIFPYNIHFYLEEYTRTVVITGIIHNKRQDALKLKREMH